MHQAGASHRARTMLPGGTAGGSDSAPAQHSSFPRTAHLCALRALLEARGHQERSVAQGTVALKWPRLVGEDLGATCTHPGDISCLSPSAEPFLGHGAVPAAAWPGYLQEGAISASPGWGAPSAAGSSPPGRQEADLAQPLLGPTVPLDGAARRASGLGWGFPKKGLNSSVEFATSLTTPFPVRGCVQPLFFSLSLFFSPPPPCPQTGGPGDAVHPLSQPGSPWLVPWPGCRYGHSTRAAPTPPSPPSTHGTESVGTSGSSTGCAGSTPALRWVLICAPSCRTGGSCFAQGEQGTRNFICRCMGWDQHLSRPWPA